MIGPSTGSQLTTYSTYIGLTLVVLVKLIDVPIPTFPPLIGETATQLILSSRNLIWRVERMFTLLANNLGAGISLDYTHLPRLASSFWAFFAVY